LKYIPLLVSRLLLTVSLCGGTIPGGGTGGGLGGSFGGTNKHNYEITREWKIIKIYLF